MRGSMFQLNTTSASVSAAPINDSMDLEGRFGYGSKQTPMTPGPGRRAPVNIDLLHHGSYVRLSLISNFCVLVAQPFIEFE